MIRRLLVSAALLLSTNMPAAAQPSYSGVFFFGTSELDTGNWLLDPTLASDPFTGNAPIIGAESCRRMAAQCLSEGFSVLALYHVRRSLALERTWASSVKAGALARRALARLRAGERWLGLSLLCAGPVRAHGLRPA